MCIVNRVDPIRKSPLIPRWVRKERIYGSVPRIFPNSRFSETEGLSKSFRDPIRTDPFTLRCIRIEKTYQFLPDVFRNSHIMETKRVSKGLGGRWAKSRLAGDSRDALKRSKLFQFSGLFRASQHKNPRYPTICKKRKVLSSQEPVEASSHLAEYQALAKG